MAQEGGLTAFAVCLMLVIEVKKIDYTFTMPFLPLFLHPSPFPTFFPPIPALPTLLRRFENSQKIP